MVKISDMPPANARLNLIKEVVDFLPEQVIGIILSYVASARDVVMASTTCRKWRKAASHHLHSLSFVELDFCSESKGSLSTGEQQLRITEAVFKVPCLLGLSICMNDKYQFPAGLVTAWLLHTKKTLRSLTFMNSIKPKLNILEKLGGVDSKLEHLEWRSAYICNLDPTIHTFQYLVSLTLKGSAFVKSGMIEVLLTACPQLEFLFLKYVRIKLDHRMLETTMELKSLSLKTLQIDGGLSDYGSGISMVLLTDRLETLMLSGGSFQQVKLIQRRGFSNLRVLSLKHVHIQQLELGESVELLYELQLGGSQDFRMFSTASNLRKLSLSESYNTHIDLDKVAFSFPHLHWLALSSQQASAALEPDGPGQFSIFRNVTVLELFYGKINEEFARCIAAFLERCPHLEKLRVSGRICIKQRCEVNSFTGLMIQIMRPFPHIDLKFRFT